MLYKSTEKYNMKTGWELFGPCSCMMDLHDYIVLLLKRINAERKKLYIFIPFKDTQTPLESIVFFLTAKAQGCPERRGWLLNSAKTIT